MSVIGITGHQRLPHANDWVWVTKQMSSAIVRADRPLVGITSLAVGSDQLFAEAVLGAGGTIHAVIPFESYAKTFGDTDRARFAHLFGMSSPTEVLNRSGSDEESYLAAGKRVVQLSDLMIAVWDGKPAKGLGGTADIVQYALDVGKRVIHINPFDRTVTSRHG